MTDPFLADTITFDTVTLDIISLAPGTADPGARHCAVVEPVSADPVGPEAVDDADRLAELVERIDDEWDQEWDEQPDGMEALCGEALGLAIALGETGIRVGLVRRLARLAAADARNDEAVALLSAVLELEDIPAADRANVHDEIAHSLTGEANPAIVEHFIAAAELFAEADQPGEAAISRLDAGEQLRSTGDPSGALEQFEAGRALARKAADGLLAARADERLAAAHSDLGRADLAERHLRDSLAVARASGDVDGIAQAAYQLAACLAAHAPTRDTDEVLGLLTEAKAYATEVGNLRRVAECDETAAVVFGAGGGHDEAVRLFRSAVAVLDAVGDGSGSVRIRIRLADELAAGDERGEAMTIYNKAATLANDLGDRQLEGRAVARAARLLCERRGHLSAFKMLDQVGSYFDDHRDPVDAPAFHLAMGTAQLGLGDVEAARDRARRALGCLAEANLPVTHARVLELLGDCDEHAGLESDADAKRAEALALYVFADEPSHAKRVARRLLPDRPGTAEETTPRETTLWTGMYL